MARPIKVARSVTREIESLIRLRTAIRLGDHGQDGDAIIKAIDRLVDLLAPLAGSGQKKQTGE